MARQFSRALLPGTRKQLRFVPTNLCTSNRDVTPLAWGRHFHGQRYHDWVSQPAMRLIQERGGHE